MSEGGGLPKGWAWARLRDLTCSVKTRNPKSEGEGYFLYIDVQALDNTAQRITAPKRVLNREAPSRARVEVSGGDVLFSLVRPYLKNIARVPEELDGQVASTAYCAVRPADGISGSYLFRFLSQNSFIDALPTYGNSPPAARDDEFYDMTVPVPPADEQRRIVQTIEEQLSCLDAGVSALKRARANLKRYRTAVLAAAVEGRLTKGWREENPGVEPASDLLERILKERRERWDKEQVTSYERKGKKPPKGWRSKYKEPARPDEDGLPGLPDGWCWSTVEQLGDVIGGLTKNRKRASYEKKLPFLRVANVYADELRLEDVHEVGVMEEELDRALLRDGDLLVVEGNGSPEQIGRVALWNGAVDPCVHQNHLIKVRFPARGLAEYVLYWLLSPDGREHIGRVASSTSGLHTLSISKVQALPVPLPPLEEQVQLTDKLKRRLSVIERLASSMGPNLKRADRLRQSILRRAFEGKLAPQDPSDEPATVLLEKIRAEREGSSKNGAGRKGRKKSSKAAKEPDEEWAPATLF